MGFCCYYLWSSIHLLPLLYLNHQIQLLMESSVWDYRVFWNPYKEKKNIYFNSSLFHLIKLMCNFTNKSKTGKLCECILKSQCTGSENTRTSQVLWESLLRIPMFLFPDHCIIYNDSWRTKTKPGVAFLFPG